MEEIKQVVVVRKDLNMRRGKFATQVALASMKFLLDNNESERGDEVHVKLSYDEAAWVSGSLTNIVSVDSEEQLNSLIFKAQMSDIDVYPIFDTDRYDGKMLTTMTCAAFGPCSSAMIDLITGNLKPV